MVWVGLFWRWGCRGVGVRVQGGARIRGLGSRAGMGVGGSNTEHGTIYTGAGIVSIHSIPPPGPKIKAARPLWTLERAPQVVQIGLIGCGTFRSSKERL